MKARIYNKIADWVAGIVGILGVIFIICMLIMLGSCDKGPTRIKVSDIKAGTVTSLKNGDTLYIDDDFEKLYAAECVRMDTIWVYDTIEVSYEYINKLERELYTTKMELESLRDFTRNLRRDSRDVDLAAMIYYSDNYDNKGNFIIK